MGDRCTGHCCRKFYLPYSPTQLAAMKADFGVRHPGNDQVPDMVIPLYPHAPPNTDANGGPLKEGPGWFYTCKNFDTTTGNCRIYETRPAVCRDYPYGRPCIYKACEWDQGRAGEYPPEDAARRVKLIARLKEVGEDLTQLLAEGKLAS